MPCTAWTGATPSRAAFNKKVTAQVTGRLEERAQDYGTGKSELAGLAIDAALVTIPDAPPVKADRRERIATNVAEYTELVIARRAAEHRVLLARLRAAPAPGAAAGCRILLARLNGEGGGRC